MASWAQFLSLLSLQWLIIIIGCTSSNEVPRRYMVYMGSSTLSNGTAQDVEVAESAHLKLLSSIIPSEESERISLIHHYYHVFKGFSAMLTDKEAAALSGYGYVVSVFPDAVLRLHTTHSSDFVHLQPTTSIWSKHKCHKLHAQVMSLLVLWTQNNKNLNWGEKRVLHELNLPKEVRAFEVISGRQVR